MATERQSVPSAAEVLSWMESPLPPPLDLVDGDSQAVIAIGRGHHRLRERLARVREMIANIDTDRALTASGQRERRRAIGEEERSRVEKDIGSALVMGEAALSEMQAKIRRLALASPDDATSVARATEIRTHLEGLDAGLRQQKFETALLSEDGEVIRAVVTAPSIFGISKLDHDGRGMALLERLADPRLFEQSARLADFLKWGRASRESALYFLATL